LSGGGAASHPSVETPELELQKTPDCPLRTKSGKGRKKEAELAAQVLQT